MRATGDPIDEARRAAVRQALGALSGLVPIGVIAVDPGGLVWYQSHRWDDLSGVPPAGARGRPWHDSVHPDDREELAARWGELAERRGRLGTFRALGPDGSVRRCQGEAVAMLGAGGTVDGYLVLVTDDGDGEGAPADGDSADGDSAGRGDGRGDGRATPPSLVAHQPMALATPHLLDAVLDRSPDIITILNVDGSWRWSSGSAVRLLGHQESFDPVEGIFELLHPTDRDRARRLLARTLAGDGVPDEQILLRVRSADGSWRIMEATVDVRLDEPAIHGVVVHLRDVTIPHKMLEELESSNRRLASLIVSMRTAAVLEDERRRVVLANRAFTDLFRIPLAPDELVGSTLDSHGIAARALVVEPPDVQQVIDAVHQGGERREGLRAVLHDGRTIECDIVPIEVQGVNRGHLTTYRDVTHQARAEAERERLLASEQEENRRLAELDAYRSESIAAVSHELRTPLTSIVGYSQLLRSMLDPATSPDEAACLDAIVRNVDRLLRLAGDVVALDSLETRTLPMPVAAVDMGQVVQRAVRTIAPEAAEKRIPVLVDAASGPPLRGDAGRLGQLFENLLSNAVKFTLPGGHVSVRAEPVGDGWDITITDDGIGIPGDEIALLSTRFFRASNARRRGFPGSGLGLSVARAIAERHGGSLAVESVVGVGTTVRVHVADAVPEHGGAPGYRPGGGPGAGGPGTGDGGASLDAR